MIIHGTITGIMITHGTITGIMIIHGTIIGIMETRGTAMEMGNNWKMITGTITHGIMINTWDNNWNNDNSWDNNQNNDNSWNNDWNDGNSWDSSWNGGNDNWWKRGKVVRLKQDGRKDQSDKQFDTDRNNKRQMNIAKLHHKSLHSADKDALQLHQLRQNDATKSDLRVKKITQRNSTRLHPQIRQLFNRKLIDRQLKPKMKKAQRLSTLKRFVSLVKSLKKGQLKTKQKDDERKQ
ncbi:unnamed protein product [Mytilus edulis]|uniref:Uncharacterized protein n=1 Tax=Mytilus edulis TaxID=6550 RepID=A0A8S3RXE5_MYTED|nr:unnamed protein product [Mytilus edulis]